MRQLRKDSAADRSLNASLVVVLRKTLANPQLAGAENAEIRKKLREILGEAEGNSNQDEEEILSVQDEEKMLKQFAKYFPTAV